jgi:hypothetical protein
MEMNIQEIENKSPNTKKRQISYDDLLSNMGFKLNNGKLELYNKKIQDNQYTQRPDQRSPTYQRSEYQSQRPEYQSQRPEYQSQRMDTQIKPAQPMTKQQYKQLLRLQYIQNLKEKERINNIKSKKLLFSNPLTIQNINQSLSVPNKFFHFSR